MVPVVEITGNELLKGLLVDMQGFYFLFLPNPHVKQASTEYENCITKPLCSESNGVLWPGIVV